MWRGRGALDISESPIGFQMGLTENIQSNLTGMRME